ncbi:SDR family NAD(P)-dependent oxidoreductase [Hyphomicrobiales bacterium]|jgi:NAD(P)-dependent dehydrogenase (short-subunit alcohol dehydrogenase family)|nr:SDR family NAD(P)-dependent oxidoreductase [Hyphomicrobiales bacterium]MDC3272216.1 SDR family NAD(P)-dependent oxidoreductase [Hyphomicrobiales bacterium]|tara:strand:+ start:714 stop:1451 length:738 start_codon:yes stop_codon:yes gene_type:complete
MTQYNNLKGKIALITGATHGIGRSVALTMAKAGAEVIAIGRTQSALEELDDDIKKIGNKATLVPLDLTQSDLIEQLANILDDRYKKLDILICNAGILGSLTPINHIDQKEWNKVISTNVTANITLLKSFDSLLKMSKSAQVLFLTSNIVELKKPFWGIYAASKAALEQIAFSYAAEVQQTNISVNLIDPGTIATSLRAKAMPGEDKNLLTQPEDLSDFFIEILNNNKNLHSQIFRFNEWKEAQIN